MSSVLEKTPLFSFNSVGKSYSKGKSVLKNINLKIYPGEFISIIGRSGAGKTTLLRSFNRLTDISEGDILFFGQSLTKARPSQLKKMRKEIAIVFQSLNLIRREIVLTNVLIGRLGRRSWLGSILRLFSKEEQEKALQILHELDIVEKAFEKAGSLSIGQQQRVSIARAILQEPRVILADEPISSLDPLMVKVIMNDLKTIQKEKDIAVICNLHQVEVALQYSTRIIGLNGGEIVFDGKPSECDQDVIERIYKKV